jgi:hypothetical protein
MARTRDDGKPEETGENGKRPGAAAGDEPSDAARAPAVAGSLRDELRQARCEYCRAVRRAWVNASQDVGKANTEFIALQRRIASDTEVQIAAAQRAWLKTMQDAGVERIPNLAEYIRAAYQGYQQAIEAAVKSGRDQWTECRQTHQGALATAREAYTNAIREAVNVYLAHVKAAWSAADISGAEPAMLASLAEASGHAVNVANALRWNEWNAF